MFARILLSFCLAALLLASGERQATAMEIIMGSGQAQAWGQGATSLKANSGDIAGPAVSQEEAVKIARSEFPELLAGKDLQVQLNDFMGAGQQVWQLSWNSNNPYPVSRPEHVSVILDAQTGDLLNADFWMGMGDTGSGTNLISREEAMKKAEEFARKMRPTEFTRTRLDEKQLYGYYEPRGIMKQTQSFNWQRVENGIAVEMDGITVGVDALSGQIQQYGFMWHRGVVFPAPSVVLKAGALASKTLADLGLYLEYGVREDAGVGTQGLPEAFLIYRLNSGSAAYFDPKTGEPMDGTGKKLSLTNAKRFSQLPEPRAGAAGVDPPGASGQNISAVEALKKAQDFFHKIGIDGTVTRSGGGSGGNGVFREESWSYSSRKDREDWTVPHMDPQVQVDIYTGEVSQYFNQNFYEGRKLPSAGDKPVLTREQALDKARNFIKLVQPERLDQVTVADNMNWGVPKSAGEYNFEFIRLVNGLPFGREGFMVNVDATSGEIRQYSCRWHRASFPDPAKALKAEEAGKLFLEKVPFELVYFFPWEEGKKSTAPFLAYRFVREGEMGLDAVNGQLISSDWMASRAATPDRPPVFKDHWASMSLALLAESGLLPTGEGFDPDGAVTRRDAVRVLMGAMSMQYGGRGEEPPAFSDIGRSDRDFMAVQMAVRLGVLTGGGEFKPEEPLTRETIAAWLVRALGHEDVAKMPNKIELNVQDADLVDVTLRNHVAIACGLGLMSGDDSGFFRPGDKLTWAELATLASKAAPRLRNRIGRY